MFSGNIPSLISKLEIDGHQHAYVDGGSTITAFINLGLIGSMTITKAPILLGKGIPLFGELSQHIKLTNQPTNKQSFFLMISFKLSIKLTIHRKK